MMQKIDLKSGEVITKEAEFHSKTEVNLESTNSNELFSKIKNCFGVFSKILNWRFHSVLIQIGDSIQF